MPKNAASFDLPITLGIPAGAVRSSPVRPTEIPELAWQRGENDETIAVCDVTPGWHSRSGKLIAIGTKLRYSQKGAQLLDKPRSHECAYATYDPKTQQWTKWKMLAMPQTDGKFFLMGKRIS